MTITVDHIDANDARLTRHFTLKLPRFLKHFAMAGAGFSPALPLLARGLGAFLWYSHFLDPVLAGGHSFGQPPPILRDPSLKAHFSNLSGRALADFLGRELEQALATWSYEGLMTVLAYPQVGPRPDLVAVGPQSVTAIEAKGYARTSVSDADMLQFKHQAAQGPIPRHRWAASVAFGLYDSVRVRYHDPAGEGRQPTREDSLKHLERYFVEVNATARQLRGTTRTINGRPYVAMPLTDAARGRMPLDIAGSDTLTKVTLLIDPVRAADTLDVLRSALANARSEQELVSPASTIDTDSMFIDTDGIGISLAS
jgi:hypothetical protein